MKVNLVSPTVYRGPRPESASDFIQLKNIGINTVLNLEMGYFDFFHSEVNKETSNCLLIGATPIHIQMGDITAPSIADLAAAVKLLCTPSYGRVYVHCLHGVDRTGLVCAGYRVKNGWTIEAALREMFDLGFHRFPYEALGWVARLREYAGTQTK